MGSGAGRFRRRRRRRRRRDRLCMLPLRKFQLRGRRIRRRLRPNLGLVAPSRLPVLYLQGGVRCLIPK